MPTVDSMRMNLKSLSVVICVFVTSYVQCQSDGSFWWLNKDLAKGAKESREIKGHNLNSKVRTLPPKFKIESSTAPQRTSSYIDEDEDEEDREMYKYGNEADCVCEKIERCDPSGYVITDGSGIIDERSFNICGTGNVCCRIPRRTTSTTKFTTTSSTRRPFFPNLHNLISTVLKPVTGIDFGPRETETFHTSSCVSHKGSRKNLNERILLESDYEEDDRETAMVGETSFAEFPWMLAVLKRVKTGNFDFKCGGVLISMKSALTAHHCIASSSSRAVNVDNFLVRAGEWDRASIFEVIGHQDRLVNEIVLHPGYYSGGLFNDLAIMKWQKPFEGEINVSPICLPEPPSHHDSSTLSLENDSTRTYCTVTGWGKASSAEHKSDKLKFVKVPIVDRTTCQHQLQKTRLGGRFRLHESFVCAGGEENRDSCDGDGGSPLVCPRKDGSYELTGLVSWGIGCGERNVPGVYTSIKSLQSWIRKNKY